jgi:hypothetical protein
MEVNEISYEDLQLVHGVLQDALDNASEDYAQAQRVYGAYYRPYRLTAAEATYNDTKRALEMVGEWLNGHDCAG